MYIASNGVAFTQLPKKKRCLKLTLKAAVMDRELSVASAANGVSYTSYKRQYCENLLEDQ
jgi:hypothetical protein